MLDLTKLESESYIDNIIESLKKRHVKDASLNTLKELVTKRKQLITQTDAKRAQRNQLINDHKGSMPTESVKEEMGNLKNQIQSLEKELESIEKDLYNKASHMPNILKSEVPEGLSSDDNKEIKKWGNVREFSFKVKSHDELGESLDILDIKRGVKISGSRFYTLKNEGALLERALINFFLDQATKNGYQERVVPFLVDDNALFGTGQLPKFQEDLFKIEGKEQYLIPTAEVPLTNLYAKEILKESDLPLYFTAATSCFRKEAGSYGKDNRGIFRVHQFQKVELVKYTLPEKSNEELESLVGYVMGLLEQLELPYRQMLLCGGDTGFSSEKTYDLEVYLPFEKQYREVSSCSSFGDFQARRAQLKYKTAQGKNEFYHTLNGSGLAIGRIWIAILENYQNEDGSVTIPPILRSYMNGLERIKKKG